MKYHGNTFTMPFVNIVNTQPADTQPFNSSVFSKKRHNINRYFAMMMGIVSIVLSIPSQATCKLPKSYYKNVTCTSDSQYFLASKDNKTPVALLDKSGKKVADLIGLQAADGNKIHHGLMPVMRYDKVGYVDMAGEIIVPIVYDSLGKKNWARAAKNGLIVVKKDGAFGVINTHDEPLIAFSHDISALSDFDNGKARMTKAGVDYWLDSSGQVIPIHSKKSKYAQSKKAKIINQVNIDNHQLIYTSHYMNGKWGFVNEKQMAVITYSFNEVMPFSEGLAGVRLKDKWGFLDKAGTLVINFRFDDAHINKKSGQKSKQNKIFTFINGKAWVGNLKNGDKICIDKQGNSVACDD